MAVPDDFSVATDFSVPGVGSVVDQTTAFSVPGLSWSGLEEEKPPWSWSGFSSSRLPRREPGVEVEPDGCS